MVIDCGRALSNSHAGDLLGRSGSIFLVGTARHDFQRIASQRPDRIRGAAVTDGGLGKPPCVFAPSSRLLGLDVTCTFFRRGRPKRPNTKQGTDEHQPMRQFHE